MNINLSAIISHILSEWASGSSSVAVVADYAFMTERFEIKKKKSFYLRVRIRQSLPVWAQPGPEESPGKHLTYWTHLFIESYKAVKTAFWKCLGLYTWQSAAYYGLFTNTAIICHYVFMPNSVRCQTLI